MLLKNASDNFWLESDDRMSERLSTDLFFLFLSVGNSPSCSQTWVVVLGARHAKAVASFVAVADTGIQADTLEEFEI